MLMTSPAASPLQQVRSTRLAAMQSTVLTNLQASMCHHFTLFFNAAKAKAFTTFLAGLALTFTNSPNAMRLPAFVAGLYLFLIMQTPGMVNLPVPFTSLPASSAKASKTFDTSDLFFSQAAPTASAMALFGIAFTPFFMLFMPFIAFIAFIAFLAILVEGKNKIFYCKARWE